MNVKIPPTCDFCGCVEGGDLGMTNIEDPDGNMLFICDHCDDARISALEEQEMITGCNCSPFDPQCHLPNCRGILT